MPQNNTDVQHTPGSDSIIVCVSICITIVSYISSCEEDHVILTGVFFLLVDIKLTAGLKLNQELSPGQRVKEKIVFLLSITVENKFVL